MNQEIIKRLEQIKRLRGGGRTIEPQWVIEDGAKEDSPLHGEFIWDDETAAHQHRLATARALIRLVKVEVRVEVGGLISVPAYCRDPYQDGRSQGYVSIVDAKDNEAREILQNELMRIIGQIRRAEGLARYLRPKLASHFSALLTSAMALSAKVKRSKNLRLRAKPSGVRQGKKKKELAGSTSQ